MNEQQNPSSYCIEKAFERGPLHLLHSYKIGQLQNKINFFEGQVDPLFDENISLKDQLVALSKLVISSTEILRNLLPASDDPTKRLKLQMASIEEIATMIKQDWHRMLCKLDENTCSIKKLEEEKEDWRSRYETQRSDRAKEVQELQQILQQNKSIFQAHLASLQEDIVELGKAHEQQKKQIREEFSQRIRCYQANQREFQLFRRQVRSRQEQYQKSISRLKGEIDANLVSFEQAKKNIKMIYEKLMGDKLSEQSQNYELLLKMKEEEKMQVMIEMGEAEEEYKRRSAQKEYEITKLTERNDRYREEVGVLKNDIWKKQLQLDKEFQEAKTRDATIYSLQKQKESLKEEMHKNEEEYREEKEKLMKVIKSKQTQIESLMQEGSASLQKIMEQKQALEKELTQKEQKLRKALISLRKSNDMWQGKIEKLKEQWKTQEEKFKIELCGQQKSNRLISQKLKQSQLAKEEIIKQHNEKLKRIEDIHKEQLYLNECKYTTKISEMQEAQEEAINQLKVKHQRDLTDLNINANDEMREAFAKFNRKLGEQQASFILEREKYDQQLKQVKDEAKSMEKKLQEARNEIQNKEIEHRQAMKHLAEAGQRQKQRWAQEMDKQFREFQNEMKKQQARLISIKEEMEKQIKMLKQANAIETIQNKFLNEISKLKEQFAEKIKQAQRERKEQVQALTESHQASLQLLKVGFNKDLSIIVQNIEQKSTFLNERLMNGLNDSLLDGLSEEQKKEYIIRKVQEIKKNNMQKEQKITEMEYALDQAERNVERRVKARKEELERERDLFAKECNKKIDTITSQCKAKVTQVENERIQHSQVMYEEFHALREQHKNLTNFLNKKYLQLETMFEQRPSRMQDLTKIKELENMQSKMDVEIQSYQKRMETANEIVKYLNLELENYKDVYDIFSPNAEGIAGGISGMSVLKTSNNNPNPHSDTKHILDVIKSHRNASEARIFSEQRKELPYRKWNETASPAVKDIKLFQDDQSEHSAILSRDNSEPKEKEKKYSYLIVDRGERRNRFKTQKNEKLEHEAEIMLNAENFIKLIKANQEQLPPVVKELGEERRKSYRKRKLHKRQPTLGYDQYF